MDCRSRHGRQPPVGVSQPGQQGASFGAVPCVAFSVPEQLFFSGSSSPSAMNALMDPAARAVCSVL